MTLNIYTDVEKTNSRNSPACSNDFYKISGMKFSSLQLKLNGCTVQTPPMKGLKWSTNINISCIENDGCKCVKTITFFIIFSWILIHEIFIEHQFHK